MHKILNEKIKKLYLDWISTNHSFLLHESKKYYHQEKNWIIYDEDIFNKQKMSLNAFKFNAHKKEPSTSTDVDFLKSFKELDFFSPNKDWIKSYISLESETEAKYIKELVHHIYKNLNSSEKPEFLAITPRLFKYENLLKIFSQDKTLFKDWIQSPYKRYIRMMSHDNLDKLLNYFGKTFKDDSDKDMLLYKFFVPREKNLLKRIESQNMLRKYLKEHIPDSSKFDKFFVQTDDKSFFKEELEVIGITIDKIGIYNAINPNGQPIDKHKVTQLLTYLVMYLNESSEEKKRIKIEEAHLLNSDNKSAWYTVVVTVLKENSLKVNFHDFFKSTILSSEDFLHYKNPNDYIFKPSISKYLMEDTLEIKTESNKVRKI